MRQVNREVRELRWRTKASVALAGVGSWAGAWLWILAGFDWSAPSLQEILGALPATLLDPYFWAVVALSSLLGGWLAWVLMWRNSNAHVSSGEAQDGMSAPRF